ncbi:urease accessory protein [Nitrospira moscoviensis]|nr:urease accessory protein [Nitrospira moscoviensis]
MLTLLGLGFLLGLRHAFEADHAAAVAALASCSHSVGETVRQGIAWGIGHALTLFLFCSVVLSLNSMVPERVALALEMAVGVMLIGLGLDVWRRIRRDRLHVHIHEHEAGKSHIHIHAHRNETDRAQHQHAHQIPYRALLVGMTHGMAGSAALILLTLHATPSIALALTYIIVFGLGSILGMATLSLAIAIPLRRSARSFAWAYDGVQIAIGGISVFLGASMLYTQGSEFLG